MPDESPQDRAVTVSKASGEQPLQIKLDNLPPAEAPLAAAGIDTVPPASAYEGISTLILSDEESRTLIRPTPDDEIDIRPEGLIYASHAYVRSTLLEALGPGQWAMRPMSPVRLQDNVLYQQWALYVRGVFISQTLAAHDYQPNNRRMDYSDVVESVKSNALTRCAKDLGIGLDCWKKRKQEYVRRELCTRVKVRVRRSERGQWVDREEWQWRRKDADPLPGEVTQTQPVKPSPFQSGKTTSEAAPPPKSASEARTAQTARPTSEASVATITGEAKIVRDSISEAKGSEAKPPSAIREAKSAAKPRSAAPPPVTPPQGARIITDQQVRYAIGKSRAAGLITGDDAGMLAETLARAGLQVPDDAGKTVMENCITALKSCPFGTQFQKVLSAIDAATGGSERI